MYPVVIHGLSGDRVDKDIISVECDQSFVSGISENMKQAMVLDVLQQNKLTLIALILII